MSIFDRLKRTAPASGNASPSEYKKETFHFDTLPESLSQLQALPEAQLQTPYQTAALTVCALCAYAADKNIGIQMLNWLRGPRPLSNFEISFLDDRLRDGKHYVPFSYFSGATPENDYMPTQPFTLNVESNPTFFKELVVVFLFGTTNTRSCPLTADSSFCRSNKRMTASIGKQYHIFEKNRFNLSTKAHLYAIISVRLQRRRLLEWRISRKRPHVVRLY